MTEPKFKQLKPAYGFDEVALVPGDKTVNPNEVDTSWKIGKMTFNIPILAASMDGVVNVKFAVEMGNLGGIAALNLDGIQTRYENPEPLSPSALEAAEKALKSAASNCETTGCASVWHRRNARNW